uniref:MULE transposase domain-containing protein n=1 Tax=Brassica oleracea var. oleracea TaxID=109376 RepID=A0A0D2ZTI9_BRAOL
METVGENTIPSLRDESDDEEEMERHAFRVEEDVAAFISKPPIRHNIYPDSETDRDTNEEKYGEEQQMNRQRTRERYRIRRGDGNLFEGQVFFNAVAFEEAVLDYCLKSGDNIKQYSKGEPERWYVKVYKNAHSCVPNGECEMLKVPVIARLFVDKIREEPKYFMPMKIEELIRKRWKITVSRAQCQAARNKAMRWIEKEYDTQFGRIRYYAAEILESNINSSVEVETKRNEEGKDVFDRFYVCFDVLRGSWKATCRLLIGMDGTFLRGKTKGQLLVALDLGLGDGDGYIMVSDCQKGLIKAVQLELPKMEHRMCVRHIYGNMKAKHGNKSDMKPYIWQLAWSYNEAEYKENLNRMFNYDSEEYADVIKTNPMTWVIVFLKLGNYCEDVENNSTESFNASIVCAREKPMVPMLDTIARLATCGGGHTKRGEKPLRGARFWPTSSAPEVHPAPEPDQPGRKKKKDNKRKKGKNESHVKKKPKALKRIMHCGLCSAPNHNIRFHKGGPHKKAPQAEPSQIFASQGESSQA